MKIPASIRIGGHDVEIKKICEPNFHDYGDYNRWFSLIRLNTDGVKESKMAETFLHEIIEAINGKNELKMEHHVIMTLSEDLFAIIRNNKLDFVSEEVI